MTAASPTPSASRQAPTGATPGYAEIEIELDDDVAARLAEIAARTGRTIDAIAEDALREAVFEAELALYQESLDPYARLYALLADEAASAAGDQTDAPGAASDADPAPFMVAGDAGVSARLARAANADQVARFGGAGGLRDQAGLEAALARPRTDPSEDIRLRAAGLFEGLAGNHPFLDGNKRTAFAVTWTYLRANGFAIAADPDTAAAHILALFETGDFRKDRIAEWLTRTTVARRTAG